MIEVLEWIWIPIKNALILIGIFYMIPYLVRRGWGDAENKTKKVCDTCFRDIKKWNEFVKANSHPKKEEVGK